MFTQHPFLQWPEENLQNVLLTINYQLVSIIRNLMIMKIIMVMIVAKFRMKELKSASWTLAIEPC